MDKRIHLSHLFLFRYENIIKIVFFEGLLFQEVILKKYFLMDNYYFIVLLNSYISEVKCNIIGTSSKGQNYVVFI